MDDKENLVNAFFKIELRYASLQVTGKRLVGETDLASLGKDGGDAHPKLGTETETNWRQNRALHNDVADAHRSAFVNPLHLRPHEKRGKYVIGKEKIRPVPINRTLAVERD